MLEPLLYFKDHSSYTKYEADVLYVYFTGWNVKKSIGLKLKIYAPKRIFELLFASLASQTHQPQHTWITSSMHAHVQYWTRFTLWSIGPKLARPLTATKVLTRQWLSNP